MNTIFILIVTAMTSYTSPIVVARFSTLQECRNTLGSIEKLSDDKSGMRTLRGICVEAKGAV